MNDSPVKAAGPLRSGVVVPTLILLALVATYFVMFFDHNLRRGLEFVGTRVVGAEVNVGQIKTSLLHAGLEISDVQVTDKNHPERNLVRIGRLRFRMLWDALLRAKIVIADASVMDIEALTLRAKPGLVTPPAPPSAGPGLTQDLETQVLAEAKQKYHGNVLGDLAGFLQAGTTKVDLDFKSEAKMKEIEALIKTKRPEWEKRIKALPQTAEFKQFEARIKALKLDFKNPGPTLKEADQIRRDIEAKVKALDASSRDVRGEMQALTGGFKDLEKLAQEDFRDLKSRLKLPSLNAKEFSQALFWRLIENKLGGLAKYVELARRYMPAARPGTATAATAPSDLLPPKRSRGKTYHFPIATGYPRFWLKHAALSSHQDQGEFAGDVRGDLTDVSSDPTLLKEPAVLMIKGDFPKAGVHGLDVKVMMNHTGETPKDFIQIEIAQFPVAPSALAESPDLKLLMKGARGESRLKAELIDDALKLDTENTFTDVTYEIVARNAVLKSVLENVVNGIPKVTVNATVTGSLSKFDIALNSNLGEELAQGFKKQLRAEISKATGDLEKLVHERIDAPKAKLRAQIDQALGPLGRLLDQRQAEAGQAQSAAKAQPKSQLEDEGKKLLKKFGF